MQTKNFVIDKSLKDSTKHQKVIIPIACFETTISQNILGYIPLHWHDEIQFVRVVKGEAIFQVNEDRIVVRKGEGLFINSGCLHLAKEKEGSGCVYICLNLSPHVVLSQELYAILVKPYIHATNLPYLHLTGDVHWGKNILNAISQIHQYTLEKSDYFEMDIAIQLAFIWKNLIVSGFPLHYNQEDLLTSERMKEMLNYIHQNYAEKIMLEDIAKAGQLSRSECCRYFKRFLKTTPLNYVKEYRIGESLHLLQQGDLNVTEVAYKVGFNSTSYFINSFKSFLNTTPFAYKKNGLKK